MIKLTRHGRTAKLICEEGFVLISDSCTKVNSISFKIKLKNHIVLGIALPSAIIDKKYGYLNSNTNVYVGKKANHGIYGLDERGMCLFSNNPE